LHEFPLVSHLPVSNTCIGIDRFSRWQDGRDILSLLTANGFTAQGSCLDWRHRSSEAVAFGLRSLSNGWPVRSIDAPAQQRKSDQWAAGVVHFIAAVADRTEFRAHRRKAAARLEA
jgi:hypothetical protein